MKDAVAFLILIVVLYLSASGDLRPERTAVMASSRARVADALVWLFSGRRWILSFLAIAAIPALLFGPTYIMNVFVTVAFFSIVAVGLDLLMGYGGLPTFGHHRLLCRGCICDGHTGRAIPGTAGVGYRHCAYRQPAAGADYWRGNPASSGILLCRGDAGLRGDCGPRDRGRT